MILVLASTSFVHTTISLGQSGGRSSVRGPELRLPYRRRPSFHEYMSVVGKMILGLFSTHRGRQVRRSFVYLQNRCTNWSRRKGRQWRVQSLLGKVVGEAVFEVRSCGYHIGDGHHLAWEEGKDDPWLVFHTSGTTGSSFLRVPSKQVY
jgi:hypothetical protein